MSTEHDAALPELPPMPEVSYLGDDVSHGYDHLDMRAYARAAIAQHRAQEVPLLNALKEANIRVAYAKQYPEMAGVAGRAARNHYAAFKTGYMSAVLAAPLNKDATA